MELVELTEYLLKQLLPDETGFEVKIVDSDSDIVIQILVPSEYMSLVIGRSGKIANSIRTIVQAAAYTKKMSRVRINIDSL